MTNTDERPQATPEAAVEAAARVSESKIPPEAIKAAWLASLRNDLSSLDIVRILEGAAPHMRAGMYTAEEVARAFGVKLPGTAL